MYRVSLSIEVQTREELQQILDAVKSKVTVEVAEDTTELRVEDRVVNIMKKCQTATLHELCHALPDIRKNTLSVTLRKLFLDRVLVRRAEPSPLVYGPRQVTRYVYVAD